MARSASVAWSTSRWPSSNTSQLACRAAAAGSVGDGGTASGSVRYRDGWRRWRGAFDKEQYPRVWLGRKRGGFTAAYRLIYTWEQGPIPKRWTIDHACGEKDCLDHPQVRDTRREPASSTCTRAGRAADRARRPGAAAASSVRRASLVAGVKARAAGPLPAPLCGLDGCSSLGNAGGLDFADAKPVN
jgi:hypothetical protein